jgi:transposase
MPIQSTPFPPLPRDTARAAEAAFGKGNIYLVIGDQVERLLAGGDLADLATQAEKSASTRTILALVTAFQYAENLPDRRAAEAVRTRTDWKYALHLPLDGPGFDRSELCEFRKQLLLDPVAQQGFQHMLDRLAELGLWRNKNHQRVEVVEVLTAVCLVSRLERLAEAMRITLEALATRQPEWLRTVTLPHWYERYNQVFSMSLLPHSKKEQEDLAQAIGMDARYLHEKIEGSQTALALLPEVQSLRRELQQQFN